MYGDEVKFGGGKTIREGMGQATGRSAAEVLDLVITNALIVDWSGIYKACLGRLREAARLLTVAQADIGVKDGKIK